MDLIVILLLFVCAVMLVTGKALNINLTHTHKVEELVKPEPMAEQEHEVDKNVKELAESLQDILGVMYEE